MLCASSWPCVPPVTPNNLTNLSVARTCNESNRTQCTDLHVSRVRHCKKIKVFFLRQTDIIRACTELRHPSVCILSKHALAAKASPQGQHHAAALVPVSATLLANTPPQWRRACNELKSRLYTRDERCLCNQSYVATCVQHLMLLFSLPGVTLPNQTHPTALTEHLCKALPTKALGVPRR